MRTMRSIRVAVRSSGDGKGPVDSTEHYPLERTAPGVVARQGGGVGHGGRGPAAHAAFDAVFPGKALHFEYSTTKGLPTP